MPKRTWRKSFELAAIIYTSIVIVIIIAAAYFLSKQVGVQGEQKNTNTAHYADQAEQEIHKKCLILYPGSEAECVREIIEATSEQKRSERDIVAQERMALWALWMLIITAGSVIATGVGLWMVYGTLHYTRQAALFGGVAARAAIRSVRVTREIGQAQVRAYLSVRNIVCDIRENGELYVGVIVANSGQSPAKNAHFIAEVRWTYISKEGAGQRGVEYFPSFPLGEIPAGSSGSSGTPPMIAGVRVPAAEVIDGVSNFHFVIKVGVFAIDVFDFEVSCSASAVVDSGAQQLTIDDFSPFPHHELDMAGIRSRAWTGVMHYHRKPERKA